MTKEDIIRMARESADQSPREDWNTNAWVFGEEALERFFHAAYDAGAAAEREACAKLVWPTQEVKVWSDNELEAMTGAFNKAQEKHGWYETIMAVGATALKASAAAIRARGEK